MLIFSNVYGVADLMECGKKKSIISYYKEAPNIYKLVSIAILIIILTLSYNIKKALTKWVAFYKYIYYKYNIKVRFQSFLS